MKYIDLDKDSKSQPDHPIDRSQGSAALAIHEDYLRILGDLPHGAKISPISKEHCDRLIDWLQGLRKDLP